MGAVCSSEDAVKVDETQNTKSETKTVFGTEKKTLELELGKITVISHDTSVFRLLLPDGFTLGLPVGQHISLQAVINGKKITRSYTPITLDSVVGYVDVLIKVYPATDSYPEGQMSSHVHSLKVGDKITVIGPKGKIMYHGHGKFNVQGNEIQDIEAETINMIAGGTGIAPMLQVARDILKSSDVQTNINLIFANRTENDILQKEELEEFANDRRFKVTYILSRPSESWTGHTGYITTELVKSIFPSPSSESVVLLCGPPKMVNEACKPSLKEAGFEMERVLTY